MKVESLKISKVFSGGGEVHYILPRFQREYAWEKANWQTLLDDIFEIYSIYDEQNEPEHFMGALVVINDGNRSGTIPAFKLVDGQQRLTTISIALCALGDLVGDSNPKLYRKIRRMLENEDEKGDVRFKLLPTEKYDDRHTYKMIVSGQAMNLNGSRSRILEAYRYFYIQLEKRLRNRDKYDAEKLFQIFANSLQVVFIDLDKRERPFEIFESLNAKGKPLTQPDLVRNYVAMMLSEEDQNEIFDLWGNIEDKLKETRTVSRIGELTAFLRHYLAYRNGVLPNEGHVYARFRDRVQRDLGGDSGAFAREIEDLQRLANFYDRFLRPQNEPDELIRRQLERLIIVESSTAYPFLLSLFDEYHHKRITRDALVESLKIIENYLIRRFLASEPTGYTNKMFPSLAKEISHSNITKALREALIRRNYPSDARIREALPTTNLYTHGARDRVIFVLTEINHFLSSGSDAFTTLAGDATIEHIMPQKITQAWRFTLGDDWETTYRSLLDTIGNLTLVTQSWNSTLSNSPWETKRDKLARHGLILNSTYFQSELHQWTMEEILNRAGWIVDNILRIWPAFGEPPIKQNYTGKTPTSIKILGEIYDVKSWREVLYTSMDFAQEMATDFERFAEALQSPNLSTEQMTRSVQLKNGWWLYYSLNANSVVNLITRAFDLLGLTSDDWEIELKEDRVGK